MTRHPQGLTNLGFYTHRSQLFAPFKGIGVNVVSFHDPVIDGANCEDTDLYEWSRRPGFSLFCPVPLPDTEVVNQFYSVRNLNGTVLPFVDTTARLALFSSTAITTIVAKTTPNQGYISTIGNMTYFSDGASLDYDKYDGTNLTVWGLPAPTVTPTATGLGFWQPETGYAVGNTIFDSNGNIEAVTGILASNGAVESPTAFTTVPLVGGTGTWTGSIGPTGTISQTLSSVGYTNYLFLYDFNLNIPAGSTIVGVVAQIPKQALLGIVKDQSVKLVLGGVISGTEHASAANWNPSAVTDFVYGGPSDLWGFTSAEILAAVNTQGLSGFGLVIAADVTSTNLIQLIQAGEMYELAESALHPPPIVVSFTFVHNVTPGNTIVVGVCRFAVFGPTTISDNQGNTYVQVAVSTSGELNDIVYVASNVAGGPTTITVTSTNPISNSFVAINPHEFSGILAASPVDVIGTNAPGPSAPFNSGAITTTFANDLIYSFIYANGGGAVPTSGTLSANTGSFSAAGGVQQAASSYQVVTSTGTYNPAWTSGAVGVTLALKSADVGTAIIGAGLHGAPVITIYYKQASGIGGPGLSGPNEPIWSTTLSGTVNDGGLTWTDYGAIETWYPLTNYPTPVVVLDSNGFLQLATTAVSPVADWDASTDYTTGQVVSFGGTYWISTYPGTNVDVAPNSGYTTSTAVAGTTTTVSWWAPALNPVVTGSIPPVWNTALGGLTDDGSYQWTNIGQGALLAAFGYAYVYGFRTIYGHLTTSSPFSLNTGAILGPLQGSITGYAISTDVVTFFGNNNFLPGNVFMVSGLTTGLYLNGQIFTVVTATPSATFPLTAVQVATHVLTVTALNNLVAGQTVTFSNVASATFLNGVTVTVSGSGLSGMQFEAALIEGDYGPADDTGTVQVNGQWTAAFIHGDVTKTMDAGVAIPLISTISGVGTGSPLCNSAAAITRVSVTANIATLTASNNFQPGLWVTISGLSNAIFLNGQQLQVIAVDQPVGTQNTWFQVYFENANYTPTADSGTATFNAIEIYRVSDGGGLYLFDGSITNPGAQITWAYDDFVIDADLNILLVAPLSHQNDPPPGAPGSSIMTSGTISAYWQGRLWLVVGNFVYFDAGPDCTNGIPEESWPPGNRFQYAGPVFGLEPTADGVGLLVYLADRVAGILGGPETISFYSTDALSNFGISNPNAIFRDGSIIGQFTTQKQYFEIVDKQKQEVGEHISDYLSANFTAAASYVTMHRDGLDVGVFISNGIDRIVRYGSNISAWSVPAFPVCGAGALRSIETTVGVNSLMLAAPRGGVTSTTAPKNPTSGASIGAGVAWVNPSNITLGVPTTYTTVTFAAASSSQILRATGYSVPLNIPSTAIVQGIQVSITGKQTTATDLIVTIAPTNAGMGAETHTFAFGVTNTTESFGSTTDLWGMLWSSPVTGVISFDLISTFTGTGTPEVSISEVLVTVTYQNPGNYLYARDINSWGDGGAFGANDGTPYASCFVTIGSITLSQLGAPLFPLQHVVGYFDAVGTLNNGGSSYPDVWVMFNEVSDTQGVGFVYLPEILQEPPIGTNFPSTSLLSLRWPINMMNSFQASQFAHHIQLKILWQPENAPNTIKAVAFKELQD